MWLAGAIDAFARWDRTHLYDFEFAYAPRIGQPEFDDFDQGFIDGAATNLSTLTLDEQSTQRLNWGSFPTDRCRIWGEERSPTILGQLLNAAGRPEDARAVLTLYSSPRTPECVSTTPNSCGRAHRTRTNPDACAADLAAATRRPAGSARFYSNCA